MSRRCTTQNRKCTRASPTGAPTTGGALMSIADRAGGVDWLGFAREAALTLDSVSKGYTLALTLLRDIRGILGDRHVVSSQVFANELAEIDGRPWKEFGA